MKKKPFVIVFNKMYLMDFLQNQTKQSRFEENQKFSRTKNIFSWNVDFDKNFYYIPQRNIQNPICR